MSERLDKFMVDTKMVLTRSQARMLIKQGDVTVNGQIVTKAGQNISSNDQIEIKEKNLYVSRGAYKLKKAIQEYEINFSGLVAMDCGASTGGFSQVLLENNIEKVYALDVGHDQLSEILKTNPKIINREGINLKNTFELDELCDCFVMDISFISIKLVLDRIIANLKPNGFGVLLIKPQFEVGKEKIGKGGLVSEKDAQECKVEIESWLKTKFKNVSTIIESPIKGKTGNKEFLVKVEL